MKSCEVRPLACSEQTKGLKCQRISRILECCLASKQGRHAVRKFPASQSGCGHPYNAKHCVATWQRKACSSAHATKHLACRKPPNRKQKKCLISEKTTRSCVSHTNAVGRRMLVNQGNPEVAPRDRRIKLNPYGVPTEYSTDIRKGRVISGAGS